MMCDIARIVGQPTEEDRQWFPQIAGTDDVMAALKDVWENYRDDSFIAQFLSPHLMRKWRLFHIVDQEDAPKLRVQSIHNERGYHDLRRSLASDYEVGRHTPDIQVVDVDLSGSRRLVLHHRVFAGKILEAVDAALALRHLTTLWGYDVVLEEVDAATNEVLKAHMASPDA
jgi:spore cortex formation protein SpoVR/YcgB (stage V sporulation)